VTGKGIRAAVVGGVLAVGLPLSLWAVSAASVSPEQRIADAEPPPPPTVDVELEERDLRDTLVFRGVVRAVENQDVTAPDGVEASPVIVDLPVTEGEMLRAGDVVAVVADRPIIVLPMQVPLYRALDPTSQGPDVERYQTALEELGYEVSEDERGRFGDTTQEATRRLYEDRGYPPAAAGSEVDEALAAAEGQRASAAEAVQDAENALQRQETALARQRGALTDARGAEDAARAAVAEADEQALPAAEESLAAATSGVDSAEAAVADAEEAVADSRRALGRARRTYDEANAARDAAEARVGVRVPSGEILGVAALPAAVSAVAGQVGDVATDGPILSFTPSAFVIEATVDSSVVPLLAPGVRGVAGDDGWDVEVVSNQGRTDDGRPQVMLRPDDPLTSDALGRDVRIEAELAATDAPVLAAPVTAIRSDADGHYLLVVDGDDATRRVPVSTGASIGGWVEIVEAAEELGPGTLVRAG
jgi:HlyD family secretion protein